MVGVPGVAGCDQKNWEVTTSWRYFRSHRHFVGTDEQEERAEEGSQVKNTVNSFEVDLKYTFGPRWDLQMQIPYRTSDRNSPVRDPSRVVVDRYITHADGIGDIQFLARRWMLDPSVPHHGNFTLGFGLKFPTGNPDGDDLFYKYSGGGKVPDTVRNVDQSIQLGDGGFGQVFDIQGSVGTMTGSSFFYGSLNYLFNPETTDRIETGRSAPEEKYMSIADQYLARVGAGFGGPGLKGWTIGIGMRGEGVPPRDAFGSSDWFRRPGYTISVEPWFAYVHGDNSFSLSYQYAVERNRVRSVPDIHRGAHGDAAFADDSWQFAWSRRFGRGAGGHHDEEAESKTE